MIEFHTDTSAAAPGEQDFAVSVIGIGGAGANVIDRIALDGMPGVDLICMNCDVRALTTSMAGRKVQLGRNLTQGLGCGGDPELGLEAAMSSSQEIRELLAGRSMIFLSVGLGGGTGSGAAPYVARLAREAGAFVVIFATLPFGFEGRRRTSQALAALQELRQHANALVTFENDRMGELIVPRKGVQEAFETADRIIGQSVRAVTSLVTQPGLIRIGMDDLITALRNTDSRCLFGFGQAKGENRGVEALGLALKSPLLDRGQMLSNARNVLVHVCGGSNVTLYEIETLMRELSRHVHEDAQILFGAATDARLNEHLSVTIITSLSTARPERAETIADDAEEESAPVSRNADFLAAALQPRQAESGSVREPAPPVQPQPVDDEPELFDQEAVRQPVEAPQDAAGDLEEEITADEEDDLAETVVDEPEPEPAEPEYETLQPDADDSAEEFEDPVAEDDSDEEPVDAAVDEPEIEPEPEPEPVRPRLRDIVNPAPARTPIRRPAAPSAHEPESADEVSSPPPPIARTPAPASRPAPARPQAARNPVYPQRQETFDERLTPPDGGRFGSTQPNLEEGEDLDVPTFLRKKK